MLAAWKNDETGENRVNTDQPVPTVLITGANRGIGLELCRTYLSAGWAVIALCRKRTTALDELQDSASLEIHCLDLLDDNALARLAGKLNGRVIDVLINNAGTMGRSNFAEAGMESGKFGSFNREEWHEVFDINVCTPMRLMELLVDNVEASGNGRMITVSSIVGSMEMNKAGSFYAYRASKAAVNSIMKSLSVNLAPRGIIAVPLHPGFVSSDMSGSMGEITPQQSAAGMFKVIDDLAPEQSGQLIAWDGSVLPW